jgi:hypothetical protein
VVFFLQTGRCTGELCLGSVVAFNGGGGAASSSSSTSRATASCASTCREPEEVIALARDFFEQYFASIKRLNSTSHKQRLETITREIEEAGTYSLTETELVYGAKLAWRNSVRCIGRIQWAKLQVRDKEEELTWQG